MAASRINMWYSARIRDVEGLSPLRRDESECPTLRAELPARQPRAKPVHKTWTYGVKATEYAAPMPSTPPFERDLRILIADDHRLFAESLMTMLNEDERVDVVGMAENGREAVELALDLQPDVILMDLKMPVLDGLATTQELRAVGSDARILILTGTDEAIGSEDAAAAGANGYVRKEDSVAELKQVLLEIASLAAVLGPSGR